MPNEFAKIMKAAIEEETGANTPELAATRSPLENVQSQTQAAIATAEHAVMKWFSNILQKEGLHHSDALLDEADSWEQREEAATYALGVAGGDELSELPEAAEAARQAQSIAGWVGCLQDDMANQLQKEIAMTGIAQAGLYAKSRKSNG